MHGFNRALRVSFIGLILSDIILGDHYTDLWAVHVEGGEDVARNVAAKHGFVFRGQVRMERFCCFFGGGGRGCWFFLNFGVQFVILKNCKEIVLKAGIKKKTW